MIKKIGGICVLVALCSFVTFTHFRDLVVEKLEAYTTNFPEKIYVQTDKPYYTVDDDIWFATYLVNGVSHTKSTKSNIIYVELINDKDSIVSQRKLYTDDLSVAGDFSIKKEWKPGNYVLRAYTNYMRNSDPDHFFQKEIPIWSIETGDVLKEDKIKLDTDKGVIEEEQITERPDVGFYPEGGYLINGIQCKIGIKVKDKNNKNIRVEGVIRDSDNNLVSEFKTFQFGLGLLTLVPETNETYYASIIINGEEEKYELPKALPQGYNLSLINNGSQINLKATSNIFPWV